ncbi:hypothetical protein AB0L65_04215 [Nonomuraea sp. NPDC052116]|uniref:hypothetical protein n=1 Tax=Nonomuraea sp. NPDC052116 TaxID=3155665 RepID=UPI0034405D94
MAQGSAPPEIAGGGSARRSGSGAERTSGGAWGVGELTGGGTATSFRGGAERFGAVLADGGVVATEAGGRVVGASRSGTGAGGSGGSP